MMCRLFLLLLIFASYSCMKPDDHANDGAIYKEKLVAAIRSADSIRLTEHSHWTDFPGPLNQRDKAPFYAYRSQTLSQEATVAFLEKAENLSPATIDYFAACIFAPHHTIEFQKEGKITSTMEICFKCGQLKWDASAERQPEKLMELLEKFVSESGYEPDRDWEALAKQHSEQNIGSNPASQTPSP